MKIVDKKSDSINSQRTPKGELWLSIPAPGCARTRFLSCWGSKGKGVCLVSGITGNFIWNYPVIEFLAVFNVRRIATISINR